MNDLHARDYILNQLTCIQNRIEDNWQNMTNKDVEDTKKAIDALWTPVCRRRGR